MKNSWQWFVHPRNPFTNESIAMTFDGTLEKWPDEAGKEIEVFRMQWSDVAALDRAQKGDLRFQFTVYCRWGNSGPIKIHEMFLKRKKAKVAQKIGKQLRKLRK